MRREVDRSETIEQQMLITGRVDGRRGLGCDLVGGRRVGSVSNVYQWEASVV